MKGFDYMTDLAKKNEVKMDKALEPLVAAATKVGGRQRSASIDGFGRDPASIRSWTKDNSIEFPTAVAWRLT